MMLERPNFQKHFCFVLVFFLLFVNQSFSQVKDSLDTTYQYFKVSDTHEYGYTKPTFFDMVKYVPGDLVNFGEFLIQKENLFWVGASVASTVALVPFDQEITDASSDLGSHIGWDKDHSYSKIGGVLRVIPNDINSAVYYIGNGGTTLLLSGGFYAMGLINKDYRALNTASELVEVIFSVGVVTQAIKRVTGRESPSAAIENGNPGGHWTPFPSFKAYQTKTPSYDAMPSGHIATFMATVMVIGTNYPEVKWIKPVGYSLAGLLAFEMASSKVHWVSDYPLAILIGYAIGKNIAMRRITKKEINPTAKRKTTYKTNYSFSRVNDTNVVGVTLTF